MRDCCTVCILIREIMSIITVALVSVWISVTSGISLPSTGTSVPNPGSINTLHVWPSGTSCKDIHNANPSSPTGDYPVLDAGQVTTIHCNMDGKLCGKDGPWTRIGHLDMSDYGYSCPSDWDEYTKDTGGVRTCRRSLIGAGCNSAIISSLGIPYTEICGRVVGYQYATTDAVFPVWYRKDINKYYVDGVSITRGSPRRHVWTLISGLNQDGAAVSYHSQCPCHRGCGTSSCAPWAPVESFIGNDWYCESGNHFSYSYRIESFMSDQLWDGKDCQPDEYACCDNKLGQAEKPWFHKVLPGQTTEHLEIRICSDEDKSNEDVLVTAYDLYVK